MTTKVFPAMGTVNSISADCSNADIAENIRRHILELHNKFNIFDSSSEVSAVNNSTAPVCVSDETYLLIKKALFYYELTDGAFDITALPLIKLWKNAESVPDEKDIAEEKKLVDFRDVIVCEKDKTVMLRRKGQCIDLGGIAKGFAADEAMRMLTAAGVKNAVINFGGTVIAAGDEKAVGIQDPFGKTGEYTGTVSVRGKAVVTSGIYEKYKFFDGRKYHHIIDPASGYPSETGLAGVTLIGGSACELDALAAGAIVLGAEKGARLISERNIDGIFIYENGDVFTTEGIRDNFRITGRK